MSRINLSGAFALGLSLVLFNGRGAFAQSERRTIEGTVRDTTDAVLIGAKVIGAKTAAGIVSTSITTTAGEFTIPDPPVGAYTLQVTMERFQRRGWSATRREWSAT
jgi:Carboxypeptidase regulatory-like domain